MSVCQCPVHKCQNLYEPQVEIITIDDDEPTIEVDESVEEPQATEQIAPVRCAVSSGCVPEFSNRCRMFKMG